MLKKVFSSAAIFAVLAAGSTSALAAPLAFSYDNVVVTETNVDTNGDAHVYHVGILTPNLATVSGGTILQTIDFNVGTAFTVGVPDPISGLMVVSSDLSISYDVDPGDFGPITSIHSYKLIFAPNQPAAIVANETVTANGHDYFLDPSVDTEVDFAPTTSVHVLKDIEIFAALDPNGTPLTSGTSIIRQGVDSKTNVPEPGTVAMLIGVSISGGFLAIRRRK